MNTIELQPLERFGRDLLESEKRFALARYIHRFTKQHRPKWADRPSESGTPYPVQFQSDADWLANTVFKVTRAGRLDRRAKSCRSYPTWPDNPELR